MFFPYNEAPGRHRSWRVSFPPSVPTLPAEAALEGRGETGRPQARESSSPAEARAALAQTCQSTIPLALGKELQSGWQWPEKLELWCYPDGKMGKNGQRASEFTAVTAKHTRHTLWVHRKIMWRGVASWSQRNRSYQAIKYDHHDSDSPQRPPGSQGEPQMTVNKCWVTDRWGKSG